MKICRFTDKSSGLTSYGVIEGEAVRRATFTQMWSEVFKNNWPHASAELALANVEMVAPVSPSKIVCVGRNYREHAAELGNPMPTEPLLFLKAPSSIIGPDEAIELPPESEQVEHE